LTDVVILTTVNDEGVSMRQDSLKEDVEIRRAMALESLREGWRRAEAAGYSNASDEEINAEIARIRSTPEDQSECD
jgi:hypothetical protein